MNSNFKLSKCDSARARNFNALLCEPVDNVGQTVDIVHHFQSR